MTQNKAQNGQKIDFFERFSNVFRMFCGCGGTVLKLFWSCFSHVFSIFFPTNFTKYGTFPGGVKYARLRSCPRCTGTPARQPPRRDSKSSRPPRCSLAAVRGTLVATRLPAEYSQTVSQYEGTKYEVTRKVLSFTKAFKLVRTT